MNNYEVCFCEPFILPGILPTLGIPTLKAVLNEIEVRSYILYPSLNMFVRNRYYKNEIFLKCINDIPLQFSEILFNDKKKEESLCYLKQMTTIDKTDDLISFIDSANEILSETVDNICSSDVKVLCYSLTFGDYNFAFQLFKRVKKKKTNTKIVVGGSMCNPAMTNSIMKICPEIDYIICDDDVNTFKELIQTILLNKSYNDACVANKNSKAIVSNKIEDLNNLPCPDFTDFLSNIEKLHIKKENIIVPYEISRGCWWGEKKPCAMCGYFGYQKKFLIKSPSKVIEDIKQIHKRYGINYIRFTDLVAPQKGYIKKLDVIDQYNMHFFWELRPNIDEEYISMIRKIGVFYIQIGLESLSTNQLKFIHKGTDAINNIYLLVLLMSYRIRVDWNYLYGFKEDEREWYEEALLIMPNLYHLFPPTLRQVWINKESRIFIESNKNDLKPIGSKVFHSGFPENMEVFYHSDINEDLRDKYIELSDAISKWKENFYSGFQLSVIYDDFNGIHILRKYENEEHIYLSGFDAELYEFISCPKRVERIKDEFSNRNIDLEYVLDYFLQKKIAVYLDGKYLAIATRSTSYKWKNYYLLKTLFDE